MLKNVIVGNGIAITPKGVRFAEFRRVKDMADVMMKPSESDEVVYEVFRDVAYTYVYDLRTDLTILKAGLLPDGEYNRTHGHKHPCSPWGKPWPELYCVLKGTGLFLLHDDEKAYLVEVKEGDLVHVPGEMAHIIINTGDEDLITCNYVSASFKSDYEYLKVRGGPALFVTKDGIVLNKNYKLRSVYKCKPLKLDKDDALLTYAFKPSLEDWLECSPYI